MLPIYAKLDTALWSKMTQGIIQRVQDELRDAPQTVLKPAMKGAILIVKRAAKAKDWKGKYGTGFLKTSLKEKVTYNSSTRNVTGMVGAEKGLKRPITVEFDVTDRRTGRIRHIKLKRTQAPSKYLHLVEHDVAPHYQPKLKLMHPGTPGKGKGHLGRAMDDYITEAEIRLQELIPPLLRKQLIK